MYSRPVARLLWCAPSSERGVVQHWGNKSWQCSVRVAVGTVAKRSNGHTSPRACSAVSQACDRSSHACNSGPAASPACAACRMQSHAKLALIRAMHALIHELIRATVR